MTFFLIRDDKIRFVHLFMMKHFKITTCLFLRVIDTAMAGSYIYISVYRVVKHKGGATCVGNDSACKLKLHRS